MINKEHLEENIIKALGLQALSLEKKKELLDKMVGIVQKKLTLRMLTEMSAEDRAEFEKILDKDPQEVGEFLGKVFPNILEIVQEEIASFKEDLMSKFADK